MKKFMVTIGSFIIMLFLGLIYAWSIFGKALKEEGWKGDSSLAFTISIAAFCLGGLVTSQIKRKVNLTIILLCDAVLILAGFVLSSFTGDNYLLLYISYGGLAGFAVGSAYNIIISIVPLHYPKKISGTVGGAMLLGFGFGGLLLGIAAKKLISSFGVFETFLYIGIAFFIVFLIFMFFIKPPVNSDSDSDNNYITATDSNSKNYTISQMIKHPYFWAFFVWQTLVDSLGLSLIGQATFIADEAKIGIAFIALTAGIASICSGFGKMLFGFLYDFKGRSFTLALTAICGFISAILTIVSIVYHLPVLFFVAIIIGGLAYGSGPGCNAAFTRKQFGDEHFSGNFAVNTLALLVAAFAGSYMTGLLQGATNTYLYPLIVLVVYMVIAFIAALTMKKER